VVPRWWRGAIARTPWLPQDHPHAQVSSSWGTAGGWPGRGQNSEPRQPPSIPAPDPVANRHSAGLTKGSEMGFVAHRVTRVDVVPSVVPGFRPGTTSLVSGQPTSRAITTRPESRSPAGRPRPAPRPGTLRGLPGDHHSTSVQISGRPPASSAANLRAASFRCFMASSCCPLACSRSARLVCRAATRC